MMIQAIQSAAPFRALCVALAAAGLKSKTAAHLTGACCSVRWATEQRPSRRRMAPPATSQRIPEHFCTVQPRSIPKECSLMPTQTSPFQGIWIPLVTPFSGGAVDGGALRRLVRHYAAAGVDGLVVCGSTGEAAALDDAEQLAVLDAVLNVADGLPVMMGLAGNHQGHVLRRLSAFGTRPLAGILAPAPYYVRRTGRRVRLFPLPGRRLALPAGAVRHSLPHRRGAGHGHAAGAGGAPEHRRHQGLRRLAGKDRGVDRRWPAASDGGRGFADAVDLVPGRFRHHRGRRASGPTCSWRCTAPCASSGWTRPARCSWRWRR